MSLTVVAIFRARVVCRLVVEDACLLMMITVGVVLIFLLVSAICVPGRLRSSSGVALNKQVHEKVVKT